MIGMLKKFDVRFSALLLLLSAENSMDDNSCQQFIYVL